MTLQEIKDLPNGTRIYHKYDDKTIFTKIEEGIFADYNFVYRNLLNWDMVEYMLERWFVK